MVTLNKPLAGDTDWAGEINDNWTTIESNLPVAATQAEMEAGSAVNVYVSPGRSQYHPSAAKAWILFDGTTVTPTVKASYNVSSLTDYGTGDWSVNFVVSFSSADYSVATCGTHDQNSYAGWLFIANDNPPTASACRLNALISGSFTFVDMTYSGAVFLGDQ